MAAVFGVLGWARDLLTGYAAWGLTNICYKARNMGYKAPNIGYKAPNIGYKAPKCVKGLQDLAAKL